MSKILFCLLVSIITFHTILAGATVRQVQVEFAFTPPATPKVIGYILYQEGSAVCTSKAPDVYTMECGVELLKTSTLFTLSALYEDNTESPQSPPFNFILDFVTPPTNFILPGELPEVINLLKTISFTFNVVDNANVVGYNMYVNDVKVCSSNDLSASTITCNTNISGITRFYITEIFNDTTESNPSNTIVYNP